MSVFEGHEWAGAFVLDCFFDWVNHDALMASVATRVFGEVASDATAYRATEWIAAEPGRLEALRGAHAQARGMAWALGIAPSQLTVDLDATVIGAHSEKEGAAGNYKGGFGFHPLLAYFDETSEAAAAMLRPGNAGANTAADQIAVVEAALGQDAGRARRVDRGPAAGRLRRGKPRPPGLGARGEDRLLGRL